MNRSQGPMALSLLAACSLAQARSTVTVGGSKAVRAGGDGLKAFFNTEHRF